jgi:hypothetical protein
MAQELTVNIKTTSDVPQAMEKAKAATSGFDKQVEGIGKKFAGAFKDIFLSFLGPMALLALAVKFVSDIIDANKKKAADAIAFAEEGQSSLLSNGDIEIAQLNKRNEEEKKAKENAANTPEANAKKFIADSDKFGGGVDKVLGDMWKGGSKLNASLMYLGINDMASDPEFQAALAKHAKEQNKSSGAMTSGKDFTAPTGFSNVIGVGANPVLEAMTRQLEEQQLQTALLQQIADKGQPPSADFTKDSNANFYGGF